MANLGDIIVSLGLDMTEFQQNMNKVSKSAKAMGDSMKGIGEKLSLSITAPMVALGGIAAIAAKQYTDSSNVIQNKTGATGKKLEELNKSAEKVYLSGMAGSMEEAGDVVADLNAKLGETVTPLDEVARRTIAMSQTFDEESGQIAKAVKSLTDSFGISESEALDMIAKGFQDGLNYADDWVDTLWEYSSHAKNAGYNANQFYSILKNGKEGGAFNLDKVGDAIKETDLRLNDLSDNGKIYLKKLGISTDEWRKAMNGSSEEQANFVLKVVKALDGVKDSTEATTMAVELMGTPYEDLTGKVVKSMYSNINAVNDFGNASGKIADNIEESFGTRLKSTIANVAKILAPFGQVLMNVVGKAVEVIGPVLEKIGNAVKSMSPGMQTAIVAFGGLLAAIGPVLMIAGNMVIAFGALAGTLATVSLPVVGIIAGIAALVVGLIAAYKNSEAFREKVQGVFQAVKDVVMSLVGEVVSFVQDKIAVLTSFWAENGAQISQAASNAFNLILSIIQFVMPAILLVVKMVWSSIQGVINGALNIIMGLVKVFTGIFTGDFSTMWSGLKTVFVGAIEFIWNLLNLMFIGRILGGIKTFITGALGFFKSFGTGLMASFKEAINNLVMLFQYFRATGASIWTALAATVKNIVSAFRIAIVNHLSGLVKSAVSTFNSFKSTAVSVFNSAKTIVLTVVKSLKTGALATFNGLKTAASAIFSALKSVILNPITSAKSLFNSTVSSLKSGALSSFNALKSGVTSIFSAIKSAITRPIESAKSTLLGIISKIKSAFAGMKIRIPKPSLPKVNIGATTKTLFGKSFKLPTFSVSWNKRGGFTDGISAVGTQGGSIAMAGEAGREAIIPLQHKQYMRPFSDAVAERLNETMGNGGGSPINIQSLVVREEADIQKIARELYRLQQQTARRKGVFA